MAVESRLGLSGSVCGARWSWRQVAISLVLLVGAFLFVRSLEKLMGIQPGFRAEGVIAVNVDLQPAHFSKERLPIVKREILESIRTRTGAISAAQVGWTPISGSGWDENTYAEGSTAAHQDAMFNRAGPGSFKTMDTALLSGRDFDERDDLKSPKVAIVNEQFAKVIFGGQNPVGRSFRVQGPAGKPDPIFQVVGLVQNTKYYELGEDFRPISILPVTSGGVTPGTGATFILRTRTPAGEVMRAATAAVAEVNPGIGVEFSILSTRLKESLMRERLMAALAGALRLPRRFARRTWTPMASFPTWSRAAAQ